MTQMLEDKNIPFMSVEDKEVSLAQYQYISAISHKTNGANIVEGENISQFYQTIVYSILKNKLADAQSVMHRFSNEISENRNITPANVTHYVEHALGVAFRLNAKLTETKAENEDLKAKIAALEAEKQQQPDIAFLGSKNVPFVHLVEAMTEKNNHEAIHHFHTNDGFADYNDLAENGYVFADRYIYKDHIETQDNVTKNHNQIAKSVTDLIWNATNDKDSLAYLQEKMIELSHQVKDNNMSGVELLPVIEFVTSHLFAANYLSTEASKKSDSRPTA